VTVETPSGKGKDDENFPVGSFLIRRDLRKHVHAFYRFARTADDIADNPALAADDKIRRLDRLEAVLDGAPGDDSPADAVISGSAPALLQMFKAGTPSAQTRTSVQIRGDAEIANLYRDLFAAARPDLEEELSRWVGDMPARHLSLLAKSVRTWARRARRTAGENIAEYLQEEGRDLVTKTEMEEFLRGVDAVRESMDRIEARLIAIERRAKSN